MGNRIECEHWLARFSGTPLARETQRLFDILLFKEIRPKLTEQRELLEESLREEKLGILDDATGRCRDLRVRNLDDLMEFSFGQFVEKMEKLWAEYVAICEKENRDEDGKLRVSP
jgi:hypothetical protein